MCILLCCLFFFKQKTAYEMRISDWSSDVCSSDLVGFSTLLMAEAFPNSRFTGYDFHAPSIEQAAAHAQAHGLADRVAFKTVVAKDIAERDFDLITMFDCLHDMGDPRGCARHVRSLLAGDGTWMIVAPIGADEATGAPARQVKRLYYNG